MFDLVLFAPAAYDANCADENVACMERAQEMMRWIGEQNALKRFPDFGETPVIEAVCMTDSPRVKPAADKAGTAGYAITVRILYLVRS